MTIHIKNIFASATIPQTQHVANLLQDAADCAVIAANLREKLSDGYSGELADQIMDVEWSRDDILVKAATVGAEIFTMVIRAYPDLFLRAKTMGLA